MNSWVLPGPGCGAIIQGQDKSRKPIGRELRPCGCPLKARLSEAVAQIVVTEILMRIDKAVLVIDDVRVKVAIAVSEPR